MCENAVPVYCNIAFSDTSSCHPTNKGFYHLPFTYESEFPGFVAHFHDCNEYVYVMSICQVVTFCSYYTILRILAKKMKQTSCLWGFY